MTQRLSQEVAAVIRAEVARRRIPQTELADALGLSQATVSRRMAGVAPFELDELPVVAQLLDIPVASLIGDAA